MKIAIGLPNAGTLKTATVISLLGALFHRTRLVHVLERQGCYVHENREWIVREALKADCTHLWFVDADMRFPPDTLERLLAHHRPVVGANYHERRLPLTSTVKLLGPDGQFVGGQVPTEPFRAGAVPTGCCLIDLSIMNHVPQPWFWFRMAPDGSVDVGEDVWFCNQVRAAGMEVWCDPTIPVHHVGDHAY